MPTTRSVLALAGLLVTVGIAAPSGDDVRLLFTGDILLSRQVQREIELTGRNPWTSFAEVFSSATWVAGNLEGAVGKPDGCVPVHAASPCFDVPVTMLPLLTKAGFRAIGMANNHSSDLGIAGRDSTREGLQDAGLLAMSFENSPVFVTFGSHTAAVIAISAVPGRDGEKTTIPSTAVRQKLRLARTLAEFVIVYVHWGSELLDWPNTAQRDNAKWLIANGADLIVGHHPHVVQAAECVDGKPVYFSLGNHVFDQKYPETKEGLIADCRIHDGVLRCGGIKTSTAPGTAMPQLTGQDEAVAGKTLSACPVALRRPVTLSGFSLRGQGKSEGDGSSRYVIEGLSEGVHPWRTPALPLLSAEVGKLTGKAGAEYLFTLERHASSIDSETGARPYVYEVVGAGLVARWRGSALAWPLLDAALLPGSPGVLCALHRNDSFLVLKPGTNGTRTAAYRWNGFGFSGVDDPGIAESCTRILSGGREADKP